MSASAVSPVPVVHFSRRYRLSASHRLHAPAMSAEANRETYGKCNNPYGHGHNYFVEITVAGPVDPETGFAVELPRLDALAKREVLDRFDHTLLNADPVFAGAFVPSTENLVIELERTFRAAVPLLDPGGRLRLVSIRVEETRNNSFELPAQVPQTQMPVALHLPA